MRNIRNKCSQLGQGMTEYVVIVALVAVAAIGVYQFFGQTVRSQMGGIAKEVSGQDAADSIQKAKDAADQAKGEGDKDKGLGSYNNAGGSGSGGGSGGGGSGGSGN